MALIKVNAERIERELARGLDEAPACDNFTPMDRSNMEMFCDKCYHHEKAHKNNPVA